MMENKLVSRTLGITFAVLFGLCGLTSQAWGGGVLPANLLFCEVENPAGGNLDAISSVDVPGDNGTVMITRQNITYSFAVQLQTGILSSQTLSAVEVVCSLLYGDATSITVNGNPLPVAKPNLAAAILATLTQAGLNGFDPAKKVLVVTRQSVIGWLCPNNQDFNTATGRCDGKTGGSGPSDSGTSFSSTTGLGIGQITAFAENCNSNQLTPALLGVAGVCGHP